MRLQLINAPALLTHGLEGVKRQELGETMSPPLGILYLASYVRRELPEIVIKITDGLLTGSNKTKREIDNFDPDVVGISMTTASSTGGYQLSRQIKSKSPRTLVILGGIHPTSVISDALTKSNADLVAVGEGEKILVEVLKSFAAMKNFRRLSAGAFSGIKGIAWLDRGKVRQTPLMPLIPDLDSIPYPARDLLDISRYHGWVVGKNRPETTILSTRGCPFNCHFCSNRVWKLQLPYLRLRSPKKVMDEVEMLIKDYSIREYFDNADEINSALPWVTAYCQEKIRRKLTTPWKAMLRADKMTKDLAKLLKKSNCWYVHLGIESGNQRTIDGVGKYITLEQVISCCRLLKKEGITICGLFMFFNAWEKNGRLEFETVKDSLNTLTFVKHLFSEGLIDYMTWSQTTPYPGSKLFDTALKHRLIPRRYLRHWQYFNHSWSFVMKLPGISDRERLMVKTRGAVLQTLYLIKKGHLPLDTFPYLLTRGFALLKRIIWTLLPRRAFYFYR